MLERPIGIFDLCRLGLCVILALDMKYAFVLGRNRELSIAELGSLLGEKLAVGKDQAVVFFEGTLPGKPQEFLNRLGGTVEILEVFKTGLSQAVVLEELGRFLKQQCQARAGKCHFAVNIVPEGKQSQVLKFLLPRLKKMLRESGVSANFMNKDFRNVSGVLAVKEKLTKRGTNVSVIDEGEGKVSLGCSVALQDFEAYAKRDYGKPFRDAQVGMLPPKLAQMMVNLACHAETIFDPFCGTGTILMEAMLMGYSTIGSDHDGRLVSGAQKNIEWLRKNFKIPESITSLVSERDATELATQTVSAIVTEPYLGPPLNQTPHESFLLRLKTDLETLYLNFFKNLASWLRKGTPVIFIFPYWKKNGQEKIRLANGLVEKIESLGYSKTAFAPLQTTSLFYERPDQIVGREIVRFVK